MPMPSIPTVLRHSLARFAVPAQVALMVALLGAGVAGSAAAQGATACATASLLNPAARPDTREPQILQIGRAHV